MTSTKRRMNLPDEQMLDLHKQLPKAKTDTEKTAIERQIQATDKEIDQLVHELFGLTQDEIKAVQRGCKYEA